MSKYWMPTEEEKQEFYRLYLESLESELGERMFQQALLGGRILSYEEFCADGDEGDGWEAMAEVGF